MGHRAVQGLRGREIFLASSGNLTPILGHTARSLVAVSIDLSGFHWINRSAIYCTYIARLQDWIKRRENGAVPLQVSR
jgi:hypothetical protein